MKYFINTTDGWGIFSAVDIEDLAMRIAKYYGVCTDLFKKAITGCTTDEDYFKMYNVFINDPHREILDVWKLSEHIYGGEK